MNRFDGSCSTVEDLFARIFVPNKKKDVSLKVFNMVEEKNESKALVKHVSRYCICEFDGGKCRKSVSVSVQNQKNISDVKRIMLGTLVNVMVSVTNILRFLNTRKTFNA